MVVCLDLFSAIIRSASVVISRVLVRSIIGTHLIGFRGNFPRTCPGWVQLLINIPVASTGSVLRQFPAIRSNLPISLRPISQKDLELVHFILQIWNATVILTKRGRVATGGPRVQCLRHPPPENRIAYLLRFRPIKRMHDPVASLHALS